MNRGRIRSQVFGHAYTHLGSAQRRRRRHRRLSSNIIISTGADVSLSASVTGCCRPAPPIAAHAQSATPPTMPATTGGAGQGWIREMQARMEQRKTAVNPVMMNEDFYFIL